MEQLHKHLRTALINVEQIPTKQGSGSEKELNRLLKGLGCTHKKADSLLRWAVLNTILVLPHHENARSKRVHMESQFRPKSQNTYHDKLDFKFLGNIRGKEWRNDRSSFN
ncbi:hypothetical protein NE237_012525 [Protea cynaroides]|uniref:Uncharacterized protein n=1 Tax=Protea cynaroides TaxID=273540 RepID=A0A9Q0JY34_9MAGN|nr:hypothetical protein NE237_012525 [Protea cynaroides]